MTEESDSDDERTVVTTSKKNRIQSGGIGPSMPELSEVTVGVDIPIYMEQMTAQLTIQKAIMTMMEQVEGRDSDDKSLPDEVANVDGTYDESLCQSSLVRVNSPVWMDAEATRKTVQFALLNGGENE